jgi:hypothetical protein
MSFIISFNDFFCNYFLLINVYLPLFITLFLIIIFFLLKVDFQRHSLGIIIFCLLLLEIFFNFFLFFNSLDFGPPIFFIGDLFVWDTSSSYNKIIMFFFAFLIL